MSNSLLQSDLPACAALIVAAGKGVRAGLGLPKQYYELAGKTVLRHTIEAFLASEEITQIQVVIAEGDQALYADALGDLSGDPRLLAPVLGGAERHQSVFNGLRSLAESAPDLVFIHDAVRPFLSPDLIQSLTAHLTNTDHQGVIPALPVVDTLKSMNDDETLGRTVDRKGLFRAQTPQVFIYSEILRAHEDNQDLSLTDDAAVAEATGLKVGIVEGDPLNIKLTTKADFELAEKLMPPAETPQIKIGQGFDVHRFEDGDHVTLCGIEIPHTQKLSGHSDADVALHALTDALLGAIAEGDIGDHFPPSDDQWRGAPSSLFVAHAVQLVKEKGGIISHVDLTLICEAPKVGPHRSAMQESVAQLLGIPLSDVSIKATTTERLGFTGRGEGIAAQAVASIELPRG